MKKPHIEQIAVDDLIPYANNSRKHSPEQVAQIAASIKEFGFTNPLLIDNEQGIIAGHGRLAAARKLKLDTVPAIRLDHLSKTQIRALVIADNKLALNSEWDNDLLKLELDELVADGFDIELTGFTDEELNALIPEDVEEPLTDGEDVPEVQEQAVSVLGDVWILGKHRVMCGDSTSVDAVDKLMDGKKAQLLHADPPYGMGKEADGVANDNIYSENLDSFQMEWWATFRTFLESNASAYIWGIAPDLWRLWYCGGLADSERLTFRSELVWNKRYNFGMASDEMRTYSPAGGERCLFFMLGEQGFNNNSDNYWEGWEPLRAYIDSERQKMGWSKKDYESILGSINKAQHHLSKSHFALITRADYEKLQEFANGQAYKKDYDELKKQHDELKKQFYETRAYFDNSHDNMTDVWDFPRVTGDERHGHATPKPVDMMARIMKSSLPKGGLCVEPFGGSGSTLAAAEKTGRVCYTMELQPKYVDVIIKRWQTMTGKQAVHAETGKTFEEHSKC